MIRVREAETVNTTAWVPRSSPLVSAGPSSLAPAAYHPRELVSASISPPSTLALPPPEFSSDSASLTASQPSLQSASLATSSTRQERDHTRPERRHRPHSRPPTRKPDAEIADKADPSSKAPAHLSDPSPSTETAAILYLEGECEDRESAEHRLDEINLKLTRISSGSLSKTQREAYERVNALANRARHAFSDDDCAAASNLTAKALTLAAAMGITKF